ncbi:hypothetical protein FRX31_005079, partial [Thalictrum thalictroides]
MSIFSPETKEWASHSLDLDPTSVQSSWVVRSIFFNGSLYKLSLPRHLLKFDTDQMGVRAIEFPNIVVRDDRIGCLGVLQGSLHYAWDDEELQMLVWMLGEGGPTEEWLLKHTIWLHSAVASVIHRFLVYAFHPSSDLLIVGNMSGIYRFDHATKRLENIIRLETEAFVYGGQYLIFLFSPNLSSLDSFSGSINLNHL